MTKSSRQFSVTCPSCGRQVKQHQSDLAEEQDKCPYCGRPLMLEHKYDSDSETVEDRDKIDEEDAPGTR